MKSVAVDSRWCAALFALLMLGLTYWPLAGGMGPLRKLAASFKR